jgi:hypothetical protein
MKRLQLQDYPGFLRIKAFDCDSKSGVIEVIPRLNIGFSFEVRKESQSHLNSDKNG